MVTWSVSPSLPAVLSLDSSTGAISGTTTAITSSAYYLVSATNTGGTDSVNLTIVVNDVAPSALTYSPSTFTLTKGAAMTTVTPTGSGGTITGWSVSPALPAGLSLDSSTGAISGTPTAVTSSAVYTVTATNTGGSTTANVTIVVNDVSPPGLYYTPNSYALTNEESMTTVAPTNSDGTPTSYSVSPSSQRDMHLTPQPVRSVEPRQLSPPRRPTLSPPATRVVAPPPMSPSWSTISHLPR